MHTPLFLDVALAISKDGLSQDEEIEFVTFVMKCGEYALSHSLDDGQIWDLALATIPDRIRKQFKRHVSEVDGEPLFGAPDAEVIERKLYDYRQMIMHWSSKHSGKDRIMYMTVLSDLQAFFGAHFDTSRADENVRSALQVLNSAHQAVQNSLTTHARNTVLSVETLQDSLEVLRNHAALANATIFSRAAAQLTSLREAHPNAAAAAASFFVLGTAAYVACRFVGKRKREEEAEEERARIPLGDPDQAVAQRSGEALSRMFQERFGGEPVGETSRTRKKPRRPRNLIRPAGSEDEEVDTPEPGPRRSTRGKTSRFFGAPFDSYSMSNPYNMTVVEYDYEVTLAFVSKYLYETFPTATNSFSAETLGNSAIGMALTAFMALLVYLFYKPRSTNSSSGMMPQNEVKPPTFDEMLDYFHGLEHKVGDMELVVPDEADPWNDEDTVDEDGNYALVTRFSPSRVYKACMRAFTNAKIDIIQELANSLNDFKFAYRIQNITLDEAQELLDYIPDVHLNEILHQVDKELAAKLLLAVHLKPTDKIKPGENDERLEILKYKMQKLATLNKARIQTFTGVVNFMLENFRVGPIALDAVSIFIRFYAIEHGTVDVDAIQEDIKKFKQKFDLHFKRLMLQNKRNREIEIGKRTVRPGDGV